MTAQKDSPLPVPKITLLPGKKSFVVLESMDTPGLLFFPENLLTLGQGYTWIHVCVRYHDLYYPTISDALTGAAIVLCSTAELLGKASREIRGRYQSVIDAANSEVGTIYSLADKVPTSGCLPQTSRAIARMAANPHESTTHVKALVATLWNKLTSVYGDACPKFPALEALARHWEKLPRLI